MNIYVAGSSREMPRVERMAKRAESLGLSITWPWWIQIQQSIARGLLDSDLSTPDQAAHASCDLAGIDRASIVWVLHPTEGISEGASIEYGYALHARKSRPLTVVVSGPAAERSLFASLACRRYTSDEDALGFLAELVSPGVVERWDRAQGVRR